MLSHVDAETLARLRVIVAAGKAAPPDLARNALAALEPFADREDRMLARDEHIRRAAVLIDGCATERSKALEKEAKVIERIWSRLSSAKPEGMTVRGELHAAKLIHKLPSSPRGFYNIISY